MPAYIEAARQVRRSIMTGRGYARIAKHTRCTLLVATDAPGVPNRMALFAGDEFDIQV